MKNWFISKWAKVVAVIALMIAVFGADLAQAQTEANAIINSVDAAFDLLVPVTTAIVTFFVVIRLAKRVVK